MNKTPQSLRPHIGIFGRTNIGKSTLLNLITEQETALVSPLEGTTTDIVYKAMEIHDFGPVVWMDTPGYDDHTQLGEERKKIMLRALDKCDAALLILSENTNADYQFIKLLNEKSLPIFIVPHKRTEIPADLKEAFPNLKILPSPENKDEFRSSLFSALKSSDLNSEDMSLTKNLVSENDVVILVMPQDKEAPKGRLILPQVQTLRELLDKKAFPVLCTDENFQEVLTRLSAPIALIITDSQCFKKIRDQKPEEVPLTSFSVLMSAQKGDLNLFLEGAYAIGDLPSKAHIHIVEACTHPPAEEDIGRVKIPKLFRKAKGNDLYFTFSRGEDWGDWKDVDLIVHCGACMITRQNMLRRLQRSQKEHIPITNYGLAIAYLQGILPDITLPQIENKKTP